MEILVRRRKRFWHPLIFPSFSHNGGDMIPTEQTDWRQGVQQADSAAKQAMQAAGIAWIYEDTITYSGPIVLSLAPLTKVFTIPDAKYGDRVYVHRKDAPTIGLNVIGGIMIEGTGFVPKDGGKAEVYHVIPALSLGQTLKIPLRLIGYRSAA